MPQDASTRNAQGVDQKRWPYWGKLLPCPNSCCGRRVVGASVGGQIASIPYKGVRCPPRLITPTSLLMGEGRFLAIFNAYPGIEKRFFNTFSSLNERAGSPLERHSTEVLPAKPGGASDEWRVRFLQEGVGR